MANSFKGRTEVANAFIKLMIEHYWNKLKEFAIQVKHVEYGYETKVPEDARDLLKKIYTPTALHIRFAPDYFIVTAEKVFLLEYKVMKTPRYIEKNDQWNIGQMEADAWDNYMNLRKAGIDIAILIYCPYYPRPLLCGFPNENWLKRGRTRVKATRGSGTPYVNVNLSCIDEFDVFVGKELKIPCEVTKQLLDHNFFKELRENPLLQTSHDRNSPYANNANYGTGFNWEKRYKPDNS